MLLFVAGEATVELDGVPNRVARGHVVHCPRGTRHAIETGDELAAYYSIHTRTA